MPMRINPIRAVIACLIAASIPGIGAMCVNAPSARLAEQIVGLVIWYAFSMPLVVCIGFFTLFVSVKFRHGPFIFPPIVGATSGVLAAFLIYGGEPNRSGLMLFLVTGLATSVVAAIIYFGKSVRNAAT